MKRLLAVALLLAACALPSLAQEPQSPPSFTVSSNQTYGPGEVPEIAVWSQNVNRIEFRLYRVHDPVKFFALLKDQHSFGLHGPGNSHNLTWLERFHRWKHGIWAWIRDFFRAQFTDDSRSTIREWREQRKVSSISKVQNYAQVPFLSRDQLAAVWNWTPPAKAQRWEEQTVKVPAKEPGVYLVEATAAGLRAYTIVIVSEIAVITKTSDGQVLSYVVERASGKPVSGAQVLLWVDGEQVAQSSTNAEGMVLQQAKFEHPDSVTVLAVDGHRFAANALDSWSLGSDESARILAYGYTERPIYRPGDQVHFKFLLRHRTFNGYDLPSAGTLHVELRDGQGNSQLSQEFAVNSRGTLNGDFTLPPSSALGEWCFEAKQGERFLGDSCFGVEEYKKPEYQVRVTPAAPRVIQGQGIQATIEARYFFGEPVARAKVTWVVHTSRWWAPGRFEDADDADDDAEDDGNSGDDADYGGQQEEEHKGVLDADGKLTITLPTRLDEHRNDLRYRIEARVTDEGNREISGVGFAFATYGSFFLSAQPDSYIYTAGAEAKVAVTARTYDSQPVPTDFRAELQRIEPGHKQPPTTVATASGRTAADGKGQVAFRIPESGSFRVRVIAQSREGRSIEDEASLWAPGGKPWWARGERPQRLQIFTDKKEYQVGENVRAVVSAPEGATQLLVTVEGAFLYDYRIAHNTGGSALVEFPVKPQYAPNAWISATYIKDGKLFTGTKKLKVPATAQKLNLELKPSLPQFEPGTPATYTLTARDAQGHPVQGEFSLGVVDEAIYDIRPENAADIFSSFYGSVYNQVETNTSLTYRFTGEAGKKAMQLAQLRPRQAMAQLKPDRLVQPKVRKAFPDTAYWNPSVITGPDGTAQVKFAFPDSLTTWRTTARGITADNRVGAAISKVIVRKNLLVRLVVPRFFRQGDEVTVSTIVHNYLASDQTARVSMEFDGLQVLDGATRDVPVARGAETKVDWRVRVLDVDKARVLGKALTNKESDAMELTLPVEPFGVKLADSRTGYLDGGGESRVDLAFPASAQPASRALEIEASSSVAGAIFGALDYLTSYPYGCTEQTMSSFLPNIIVAQAIQKLGLKSNLKPDELDRKVTAGLQRLYSYQHDDGAWGWWKTDDDNVFMTAYVVQGLAEAQSAHYNMGDQGSNALSRARAWLAGELHRDKKLNADLLAYGAYALAISAKSDDASAAKIDGREAANSAWNHRSSLSPYGEAVLGLALRNLGDARSAEVAAKLEQQAQQDAAQAWWPSAHDWLLDFDNDASVEGTAMALKLLTAERPQSQLLAKAAQFLVTHRNQGFWWDSTKQTAMVVFGLTDYMRQSGELNADFSAEIFVNGKSVLTHSFGSGASPQAATLHLTAAQIGQANSVRVVQKGRGRLYWSLRQQYYSTDSHAVDRGSFKLSLVREYFRLSPVQKDGRIVYHLDPMPGELNVGDTIAVRLTVGGGDWRYLMVEDPLLPGAESIPNDDLYELDRKPDWWNWWFSERELHDNRTDFFQSWFSHGAHEYVYLLKVVNPGRYRISPARVEPMYQPEYLSTTDARTVTVK
ncbi:MAG: alpha-2-macroglobulin family protein [Acidobacteriota bacterium]|nr:alpha-2-macroglobulin family protein [Acidobacteriota bacterium]